MATKVRASQFDEKFDAGESILADLAQNSANRPGFAVQRVNVDFPAWEVDALDREASRLGITKQSLIKVWIAEQIDAIRHSSMSVAQPRSRYKA